MANYAVPPDILQPYLPKGVELDLYEGKPCVSLVGFMFNRTSLFKIPIPFLGTFEEINLRFYVKRIEGTTEKRGVVFINETVPYKPVAWLANKFYKEHYMAIPTKNRIEIGASVKKIKYEWKINNAWNHIAVNAKIEKDDMLSGSIEEFIFEHYYGYTKIDHLVSQEYQVKHARWQVNKVINYSIDCNFTAMYGSDFEFLNHHEPDSVVVAEGSAVTVKWERTKF